MTEPTAKTRVKAPAPALQRASAKAPAAAHSGVRAGLPGLLQGAGPALGLGVQRQVAVGEPGDRFEREADATADRVSAGESVEPAAISPVTPETLAQTAQAAEPVKQERMPEAAVQKAEAMPEKKPEAIPVQKAEAMPEKKPEAMPVQKAGAVPEKKPETMPVQKAEAVKEKTPELMSVQKADAMPEKKPETMPVQKKGSGPGPAEQRPETGSVQKAGAMPEEKKPVQTEAAGSSVPAPASSIGAVASGAIASKGVGKPLEPATRGTLESRLGTDLSQVRVHDDSAAQSSARALNARAFTHGSDIWLGPGASQNDTRLMAHEATHVVQQSGGARRMVQRANGGGTGPPAAAKAAVPALSDKPLSSSKGTIGPGAIMTLPLLEIPQFKADLLKNTKDVTIRSGPRKTDQRQIWLDELASKVEAKAEKKIAEKPGGVPKPGAADGAKPTGGDGKGDLNRVFFYRLKGSKQNLLIGTPAELKREFVIPRWDESGRPRAMDIDHKEEWQLGGPDKVTNMQVLDAKANRSAGSVISWQVRKAIAAAVQAQLGIGPFKTMTAVPKGEEFNALKAQYEIKFTEIKGNPSLNPKGDVADPNAGWSDSDVLNVDKPFNALEPLPPAEIAKMKGGVEHLSLFPLESGGIPKAIPWNATETGAQKVNLAAKGFTGLSGAEITYDDKKKSGEIEGKFTPKKPKTLKPTTIHLPLLGIPDLDYAARMQKGGLLQSMQHAELYALSPVEFYEAHFDESRGIVAHGRVLPSLQILKNFPIEIAVEGDDVLLEATITKDAFKLPGPIQVTDGALTIGLGTSGPEAAGSIGIAVERLGEGRIGAKMGADGLELHGSFDFDKKMFDKAGIELHYVKDVFSGGGELHIPPKKIRGIKEASIKAHFAEGEFGAMGTVKPDIPAVEEAGLSIEFGKETGLKFSGDLAIKKDTPGIEGGSIHVAALKPPGSEEFKVKGSGTAKPKIPGLDTELRVSYDDGTFDASVTAAYNRKQLKGSILVGATNRPVTDGMPAGPAPEKANDITVYGGGSVTVVLGPLQGTVGVHLLPNGEIEVAGELDLTTHDFPPAKRLDKNIFTLHIDIPIFGITVPVVDTHIGIFATIEGGLDVNAGIGPGVLTGRLGINYNPSREENTKLWGGARLHVPADAGLRVFVSGGIGAGIPLVDATAKLTIGAGFGLEGALDADVPVEWTPAKGLTIDPVVSISAEPKLKVALTGSVDVVFDTWVHTFHLYHHDWDLAAFEYGSNLRFGVSFPMHYDERTGFDFSLEKVSFQVPDIKPKEILSDVISRIV